MTDSGVKYLTIRDNKYIYDGFTTTGEPLHCERENLVVLLNELRGKNAIWKVLHASNAIRNGFPANIYDNCWKKPKMKQTSLFDF